MPSLSIRLLRERACALLLLMAFAGVVLAPPLHAAPTESADVKKAREHFRKGDELFKSGRFDEAYAEFEAGFTVSNRPLFLLNMAHADRRRGELKNARSLYRRYLLMEPESKFRAEVEEVLKEIESALAAESAAAPAPVAPPPPAPVVALPPPVVTVVEPAPVPENKPVHKQWWFWAGAGGLVAIAVLGGVMVSRGPSYTKSGSVATLGKP